MAKNTSVSLGDHFDTFIAQQLKSGRYGSASEVVRAALRLLENTEARRERLRRMLDEGEKSGFVSYSYETLIDELDNENHG